VDTAAKQAADKKRQQDLVKQKAEDFKKQQETDFLSALGDEEDFLIAETAEQIASSYQSIFIPRIASNWSRPPSARRDMETEVRMQLSRRGDVVGVTIVRSSGNAAYDQSVEQAIWKTESFPELKNLETHIFEKYFKVQNITFRPDDLRM